MASTEKAIGLFGGTFDPVHNGHVAVTQSYLNSGLIDELWIILTPDPPHKADQPLSPYKLRKKMLEQAFRDVDRVTISDVENNLPRPSYTIQTILHLTEHFSRYKFYLCIGEDSLIDFDKWYRWEDILKHCELLVADRPNTNINMIDRKIIEKTHFIDHEPVEISSSGLRRKISQGEDITHLIPEGVYKLILSHNLYLDQ